MIRSGLVVTMSLIAGASVVATAPAARADDYVTYEVVSGYVHSANVEYYDRAQPISLQGVPLPWRTNATVANPTSESTDGAHLHANWPHAYGSWVTIRMYVRGSLLCESKVDTGKAACDGYTRWEGEPPALVPHL